MFYKVATKICEIVVKMLFKVEVIGIENIPNEGSCIFACNHKSNWDPIILAGLIRKRKMNGIAKKELFDNAVLKFILNKLSVIPIDRDKPDVSSVKNILRVLKQGEAIMIFPEGTRHRDKNSFVKAKAGLGMFAVKGKSNIIPISLISDYKLFGRVVIYIDKVVELEEFYNKRLNSEDYEAISENVMDTIKSNYFKYID